MDRIAKITRDTEETQISTQVNLDGTGIYDVLCSIGIIKHMLENLAKHSLIDINIQIKGDLDVDQHHTIEDTGFLLGKVIDQALGSKQGINRTGFFGFPMDDAFVITSVDFGGRSWIQYNGIFKRRFCGDLDTDLVRIFFEAFSRGADCNIVIDVKTSIDDHHLLECIFKSFAKSLRCAVEIDKRRLKDIPSTKGVI